MKLTTGSRRSSPGRTFAAPPVAPRAAFLAALCLLFTAASALALGGPDGEPRFLPGTPIEVNREGRGKIHAVRIGESRTTVVAAVLEADGSWSLGYQYSDTRALDVTGLTVETGAGRVTLTPANPVKTDNRQGSATETDRMPADESLIAAMLKGPYPVLHLRGGSGNIIIESGEESRANLRQLWEFAAERK